MNKFEKLFDLEKAKVAAIKKENQTVLENKVDILIKFAEPLFEFLDYLNDTFYIEKYGVNHHVDGAVYDANICYHENREAIMKEINRRGMLTTDVMTEWANGRNYDTIRLECENYNPVLKYKGNVVTIEKLQELVVAEIQKAIDKDADSFQIIRK